MQYWEGEGEENRDCNDDDDGGDGDDEDGGDDFVGSDEFLASVSDATNRKQDDGVDVVVDAVSFSEFTWPSLEDGEVTSICISAFTNASSSLSTRHVPT